MKIWYLIKYVRHICCEYWFLFLLVIASLVYLVVNKTRKRDDFCEKIEGNLRKKIKKESINATIEINKVKTKAKEKIEKLEMIKKETNEGKKLADLAAFLNQEFKD